MPLALSLRSNLLSLAVLSLAPVAVASAAILWSLMARLDNLVAGEARLYAHAAAAHHEGLVDGAHHLLQTLAALPTVRRGEPNECGALLANAAERFPQYNAIGIADTEGKAICATPGLSRRTMLAAAEVARTRAGFAIAVLPGHGGQPVAVALMAAGDATMRMDRIALVVLQTYWLEDAARHVGLPPRTSLQLVGPDGEVLSPTERIGSRLEIPSEPVSETGDAVTAVWPLAVGGLRVVVTIPSGHARERFADLVGNAPAEMVAAMLVALAIAGLGIHRLVLAKVNRLSQAARRIRAGELGVRTGMDQAAGEFGRLARAFDTMATALDWRALHLEDTLRASETRWQTLARAAPVAIFRTDLAGHCRYVNERWSEITGQPEALALGAGHLDCLHPEDRAWVAASLLDSMSAHRPIELSYRCRRPDGAVAWVLTRAVPEPGSAGRTLGYIGTMTDITAEKRAVDALHLSEERFRHALRHSRVTVFAQDADLVYTWVYNCPLGSERVVGKRDVDLFEPGQALTMTRLKLAVLSQGQPRRDEVTATIGGEQRILDLWVDPQVDSGGHRIGIVGAAIDVTEERVLQRALTEAREVAEQADRAKSRFLAAASHDLRQPFQAMRLFSAALAPYLDDPAAGRIAGKLDEAMNAGEMLLTALLDISTLEAGIVTPKPMAVRAADLVERLAREFQPQAEAHGLSLRARGLDAEVWTDPVLLERMLRNLLHNAVRYTRSGGILLAARRRGDTVRFEVWDTGLGIAAAEQAKVFEDFYQVGNPERDRGKGLGLGLSVVARTGRLLGHKVGLSSRPGRGSVFTVSVGLAGTSRQAAA